MARKIREMAGLLMHIPKEGEKVLPVEGERNVLITSALPYCNNVPHLGNLIGSLLSADVFARYNRTRNRKTFYVCGTDEYGTATETQAIKEGISPKELCDKYNALHVETYNWFQLYFDHFGRTSMPEHTQVCQESYLQLRANNMLEKQVKPQTYCDGCGKFLADRFVEGTCPNCRYEDARGDQCDQCSRTLDAVDLVNPRCLVSPKSHTISTRPSSHMYIRLDTVQPQLEEWIKKSWKEGKWSPNSVINADGEIADPRLKSGLRPSPVTRDLKWGVEVPIVDDKDEDGMKGKVLYVWFDAPFGYPSMTAGYTPEWKKWWFNQKNVQLYQFMGKDNVYFHTVFWPSVLIGDGRDWTKLHHISSTEYLQYESGKFSKSRNIGVFGPGAKETGVPASVWRFYLISTRPETADSTFSWNEFIAANNNILLNNFGNFVNRVTKFVVSKFKGVIPESSEEPGPMKDDDLDPSFVSDTNALLNEYIDSMEAVKLRHSLGVVLSISARGNEYLQWTKFFDLFKTDPEKCARVTSRALNLIWVLSALIHPFMPSTTTSILKQLNAPARTVPTELCNDLLAGHTLGEPEYLFKKIDEKNADVWRSRFGGIQATAAAVEVVAAPVSKGTISKPLKNAKKKSEAGPVEAHEIHARVVNPGSKEVLELERQIQAQGDKVRRIKAGSALEDDEPYGEALAELKRLKLTLHEIK